MNINWKLRFQNKTSLTAIVLAVIALVYQVLGIFGIVPAVSQDTLIQLAGAVINLFVLLGIVVDPTTEGISDSQRAMGYEKPNK
jgi:phi LC3 family holin